MLKKNQFIELNIESFSNDGSGVGRYEGEAVFVPGSAPGDKIRAKIVADKKSYAFGIIDEILVPSEGRIEPDCPLFGKCGGCSFRHISYETELEAKRHFVIDALQRIGKIDFPVEPTVPSPITESYRNKVQFPVTMDMAPGFFARRSHRTVDAASCCKLQPDILNRIAIDTANILKSAGLTAYNEVTGKGLVRHLYLRQSSLGEIMLCIVVNGNGLPGEDAIAQKLRNIHPEIKTFVINTNRTRGNAILGKKFRNIWGDGRINDNLAGVDLSISAPSFFQVNKQSAENLYSIIAGLASPEKSDIVLDLFCGTGSIGLSLAHKCKELIGVETIPEAIEDAKKNAGNNGLANCRFICSTAAEAADALSKEGLKPDIVITDPPRSGCEESTLHTMLSMSPRRIVMVSCNAATLARDLRILIDGGYRLEVVKPLDMFPRTNHVECCALLLKD